ncbi:MAG: ROK family protein [Longimonas sp.]|uniref:ROK family protein n=1 Tax=Longimonas sp. TaxID=2039626 RepID=UPI003975D2F2
MSTYALGIDLGGTSIKGALVEQDTGVVAQCARATEGDQGPSHVLDRIAAVAKELMHTHNGPAPIGLGMGVPGAVNLERTTVSYPANLDDWAVVDVRAALRERLGIAHIVVENDANVAGLGSAHYGVGTAYDSFLMVTLGTGVGGAIIHNNRVFRGSTGGAGEIGHMSIDYEGPLDNSGVAGAVEAYLGQRFLSQHARLRLRHRPESTVHGLTGNDLSTLTPRTLHQAAKQGDEAAAEILAWAGHKLGCALSSAVNLLDIRVVIVGGGISNAGDFLLDPAREALHNQVFPGVKEGVCIERENLGNEVGVLGAAHLAFATNLAA